MEEILQSIMEVLNATLQCGGVVLTTLILLIVYFALMTFALPRVLRVRYCCNQDLGRGVKRFVFEGGRGVLCEPHPAYRKYVPLYTVICREGYKLLQLKLDATVRTIAYKVVMFNNGDKVIDALSVKESLTEQKLSKQVLLHEETSYVALIVESVNGMPVKNHTYRYFRLLDLLLYVCACAATSFAMFATLCWAGNSVAAYLRVSQFMGKASVYFWPSVLIGALIGLVVFLHAKKKGIGVKIYDNK